MTDTFKPGDRVRRIADGPYDSRSQTEERGTVVAAYPRATVTTVRWEDGHIRAVFPHTIEVIEEDIVPVDSDTQSLRERLLDLAVRAAGFEDTHTTIVEAAKAFEAYITGGTK